LVSTVYVVLSSVPLLMLLVGVSVPSSFLLVSERAVISRLPVTDTAAMSLEVALPLGFLRSVRALAYDVNNDFIYWIDGRTKSIRRACDDGSHVCLQFQLLMVLLEIKWQISLFSSYP